MPNGYQDIGRIEGQLVEITKRQDRQQQVLENMRQELSALSETMEFHVKQLRASMAVYRWVAKLSGLVVAGAVSGAVAWFWTDGK